MCLGFNTNKQSWGASLHSADIKEAVTPIKTLQPYSTSLTVGNVRFDRFLINFEFCYRKQVPTS